MEKFGLFDIIDKFNSASKGENDFSKSERKTEKQPTADNRSLLKDPRKKRNAVTHFAFRYSSEKIISSRTEERDEPFSSRTSFFPSFSDLS